MLTQYVCEWVRNYRNKLDNRDLWWWKWVLMRVEVEHFLIVISRFGKLIIKQSHNKQYTLNVKQLRSAWVNKPRKETDLKTEQKSLKTSNYFAKTKCYLTRYTLQGIRKVCEEWGEQMWWQGPLVVDLRVHLWITKYNTKFKELNCHWHGIIVNT